MREIHATQLGAATRESIAGAVACLVRDGAVAFPTETVWGLAVAARSEAAVARLWAWKGRGEDRPVSLLVSGPDALVRYEIELPAAGRTLARRFWPGPLTLVLPCKARFAAGVARAGDGAVGVRCSSHPVAAGLAREAEAAGVAPLTATSLNRSGEPPARDLAEARRLCGAGPDAPHVIDCGEADAFGGSPSTVLDVTAARPRVLRWGGIGREALADCLEPLALVFDVGEDLAEAEPAGGAQSG